MLPLKDKIALVAGATRGAGRGIAVELGAAGATVYVTGRTTRTQRSEYNRPETIEETAELVTEAGGIGIAVPTDHLVEAQVQALAEKIEAEQGRLDILVNDIWGSEHLVGWGKPIWQQSLADGFRLMELAIHTHIITAHYLLPLLVKNAGGLLVEVTDGTASYNSEHYRCSVFYDLAKTANIRLAFTLGHELKEYDCTAVAITPGWLRSEMMLDGFMVQEENWQDAVAESPHFAISESPRYVGRAVASLAADPEVSRFCGQSLSSAEMAKRYGFTDIDGSQPDSWRYLVEVQEAGKPADATGYR